MRIETRSIDLTELDADADRRAHLLWTARLLSWIVALLAGIAAVASIANRNLYAGETAWGREAFRGGDVVTLVVAVPVLVLALLSVRRGSLRAQTVWIGALFYFFYTYAYAVFGSTFNDAFLLHIAVFSVSMFAIACALLTVDVGAVAAAFARNGMAKAVGIFLVIVGIGQGGLWLFIVGRNAVNGEVLPDVPVSGQHLVFALDLALLVPMLLVSGVLLARRRPSGFLLGTAMAVMGAITQLNLNLAAVYQADADVPGTKALPAEGVFLTITFVVAALVLLLGGRSRA